MSLEVSKKEFSRGNAKLSLHYAEKAMRLYPSDQAKSWLSFLQTRPAGEESAGAPHRTKYSKEGDDNKKYANKNSQESGKVRTERYSTEQVAQVKRQLSINRDDYYAVLGVSKEADDVEIKKAYRQVSFIFFLISYYIKV